MCKYNENYLDTFINYIDSDDFDYVVLDNSKDLFQLHSELKHKNSYKNLDFMMKFDFGNARLSIYRVKKR